MVDLFDIDLEPGSEEGAELRVYHPATAENLDFFITVYGPDSKVAKRAQNEAMQGLNKPKEVLTPEDESNYRQAYSAAKVIKSWRGATWKGAPLEYSFEAALMLFRERTWIREQVDRFQANRGNFWKESSPPSGQLSGTLSS